MSTIKSTEGLLLECSNNSQVITSLVNAQKELKKFGLGLWPINLQNIPKEIQQLLKNKELTTAESERIKKHFQLHTNELIKVITDSGRKPHLINGLHTTDLFVVKAHEDYSRYDRLHVNESTDGIGVDEIMQMISGSGYVLIQQFKNGETIKLQLNCPTVDSGWLVTYSGSIPHIGSVTNATIGTKILVNVLGPKQWELRYTD